MLDADFCVNTDAGGGQAIAGRPILYAVQAAEKAYVTFELHAKNAGGHSSQPTRDNAIYELAAALLSVRDLRFPLHLNDVTRRYFEATASLKTGQEAADRRAVASGAPDAAAAARLSASPYENSLLHTTCVATMLTGGHAENALPQAADATVNCRVLPAETQVEVESRLRDAVGPGINISVKRPMQPNPVSPPPSALLNRIEVLTASKRPGLPVVPTMETGGTDGKTLRASGIPTYGLAQMFYDLDDNRMHGKDERIRTADFYDGLEFGYRLMKELAHVP